MRSSRKQNVTFCTMAAVGIIATPVFAGTAHAAAAKVDIVLQDSSTSPSIRGMHMTAIPSAVPTGAVTLYATNESKDLVHEVVVVKVRSFGQQLPYDAKDQKVIESRVDRLGEIDDLKPGHSGTLTLHLRPGNYVLLCNQPGHYRQGMWAKLTVRQ
jgi:uncharacterized cupredoxin-like copper-binding protein